MIENFKGAKMVLMIDVLEGNGTDVPYRKVHYIYDPNEMYLPGSHGACVGKIDISEQAQEIKRTP